MSLCARLFCMRRAVMRRSQSRVRRTRRMARVASLLFSAAVIPQLPLRAQGVTAAGVLGLVRAEDGVVFEDARVAVMHQGTGYAVETRVRHGRFLLLGLDPGGPYRVTVQRPGFAPQERDSIFLAIGESRYLEFVMQPVPTALRRVTVLSDDARPHPLPAVHGGPATTIPEALLHRLPTLNHDLYDVIRLVPHVSTRIGLPNAGFSAAGVGFRFNDFLINGVSERTLSGNVSPAFAATRSVPLDAVREYQVLLAPYDVRYGDFAGALVNTVTASGTNEFGGSAFGFHRNDRLERGNTSANGTPYERTQYGFSVGGPIVRDRLHFLVAPELQRFVFPAAGPWIGPHDASVPPAPVTADQVGRLQQIMQGYGLVAGSAGQVTNGNPLRNLFARIDLALPRQGSRLTLWHNYAGGREYAFSRSARDTFSLSSYRLTRVPSTRLSAIQLHTQLSRAGGGHNELQVAMHAEALSTIPDVRQPIVRVAVPGRSGGTVTLNTGTNETAQDIGFHAASVVVDDALTLPVAKHVLTLGARVERLRIRRGGTAGSYGTWTFASLDAFEDGLPDRYQRSVDFGSAGVPLGGWQYALFAGDRWQPRERLSVMAGVRADLLTVDGRPPYSPDVDSIFGRRTDALPRARIELSPRLGFAWLANAAGRHQIRGGVGLFTGRPPLAWIHSALSSYGFGHGELRCGSLSTDRGPPPGFVPDYRTAPTACAGAPPLSPVPGDVDLLDRNLRPMRTLRASLAWDRVLGPDLLLTTEFLATRALSDFVFVNLNLRESRATDPHGRVLYGSFLASGVSTPDLNSPFSEVIALANTDRNRAYQFSTRLQKDFTGGSAVLASYSYSHVRDVQTPLRVNTRGIVAWASARPISGQHDDPKTGISGDDLPHRVVLAGTYTLPWRARTTVSLYYVGESGRPFTYLAGGARGLGDLNADGSNANDPIYIPRSTALASEILFAGTAEEIASQQAALDAFIEGSACLRRQRGRIMARNSCREPWSHTTAASLRQELRLAGRRVEAQVDLFNVLNLLGDGWGARQLATPQLLQHVGQSASGAPVFRFDTEAPRWETLTAESAFQFQFGLRYRF